MKERYLQQRLIPMAMEPRGVCVIPEPFGGDYTIYSSTQVPHFLKIFMAIVTGIPEHRLRVVVPEVGGAFGSKLDIYAEDALCLAMAKRLGRPVRWSEERGENALATVHGRGMIQDIELAADADGRITAVRVQLLADMGAYLQLVTPGIPLLGAFVYHGLYDIPAYSFTCTGVFTNRTPTDAYRGAGRPEATYAIERAIEALARAIGEDSVETRRRNFIATDRFPYTSAAGLTFDSGDYEPALTRALELVGYDQLRAEQLQRRGAGDTKQLGIGLSSYVEMCGLAPSRVLASLRYVGGGWEAATVRVLPTGKVQVVSGSAPHGQGHETAWSMIVAQKLGVPIEDIDVLHSDTAVAPLGLDTYGSRSASVGGAAVDLATDQVLAKARTIAAHQLEISEADLEYVDAEFRVKGTPSRTMALGAIAFEAFTMHDLPDGMEPNLEGKVAVGPAELHVPVRCPCRGRRDRRGDRARRAAAVRRGGRLRQPAEPDDRRRPDPRRCRAGHRTGAVGGGGLRRAGQPAQRIAPRVPRAIGRGDAELRARPDRDAEPDQPARREGDRRGGDDRGDARGHERGRRRAHAVRHHRHRHAGDPRTGVDGDATCTIGPTCTIRPREPIRRCAVIPAAFEYVRADSADQAVAIIGEHGEDAKFLAGGMSLIPLMKLRLATPAVLVDVGRVRDLSYVRDGGDHIAIGALDTSPRARDRRPARAAVRCAPRGRGTSG